jgi:hypothetical protein
LTRRAFIGGLLLLAAAVVLVAAAGWSTTVSGQLLCGAVALGAFCAGLLALMSAVAGFDGLGLRAWRIGPWSLAYGAFAFGLATISWIGPQTGTAAQILPRSVLRALWLIGVAMALFTIGYCVVPRVARSLGRRVSGALATRFTDDVRGPSVPWILFGAGAAGQLGVAVTSGHLGYVGLGATPQVAVAGYSQFLALLGECVPLAVAIAALRAYRTRLPSAWAALVVLFAGAIVAGAVAGGKTSFIVAVLAVAIPRTMTGGRIPARLLAAAVTFFLFFLLVVIPFNQDYRAAARGAVMLSTRQAVAAAPAIAGQVLASDLSPSVLGQSADYLAQRIRTIDSPAIIMQRTPGQIPYSEPGQLAVSPVIDLVPRILWPGKPVLDVGYQMSQKYYQLPPQAYTSSDITPEGDLYRHGGWVVLIAGMFLLGCAARVVDEVTDLRRSPHGMFLIILLFPGLVQAGTDCATLLAGIPATVLLWFGAVALSFRRRGAQPATGGPVQLPPARSRSLSSPA